MSRKQRIIQIEECEFGRVEYRRNGSYGPAVQGGYQIMILHQGYADVDHAGSVTRISAGECSLLPIDEEFKIYFSSVETSEHSWCLLSKSEIFKRGMDSLLPDGVLRASHQLDWLIGTALELESQSFSGKVDHLTSLAECFFREYVRLASVSGRNEVELLIDRALDVMHQRLAESLSVEMIAREVGMSRQHFSKVFREQVEKPVAEYLWDLRVRKAHGLICETGLRLAEIAEHTGFQNPFHLSRKIKEHYGRSPREMRK